jgi:type IV fimbrial biogenesis protein FimT
MTFLSINALFGNMSTSLKLSSAGYTLLELMVVCSILSILLMSSGVALQRQYEIQKAKSLVRGSAFRFIQDAHAARTIAISRGENVSLIPRCNNHWNSGWDVVINPHFEFDKSLRSTPEYLLWSRLLTSGVTTEVPTGKKPPSGNQFIDVSLKVPVISCDHLSQVPTTSEIRTRHLSFNPLGAAQTKHGGFVANRIVFWSQLFPEFEHQVILGTGGRLRPCIPSPSNPECKI